jgi:tetratricopeptide (TPR) repeat protein
MGHRETAGRMEKMHAELAELKEVAEHAKREGQHDKADQLYERAMRMTDEIKAHQREAGEKNVHEAEKRIVQLQEMANQAKQRGQMDKAEHLWAEAQELKGALKREMGHRETAGRMEKMHAELAELKEVAEHAKREGWHDKADVLRKKAEHLAEKIAMTAQQGKGHIKKGIEELHAMAAKAKEAGYHEKAEVLLQKAKNLGRHVRDVAERDKEKAHKKSLEHLVEELRSEVKDLRQEVERLKHSRQVHD